jgi:hypothetical protein
MEHVTHARTHTHMHTFVHTAQVEAGCEAIVAVSAAQQRRRNPLHYTTHLLELKVNVRY